MSHTANFRRQHDELLQCAREVVGLITTGKIRENAAAARKLLSKLMGKLKIHLAVEDQALYPRLIASQDPRVSATARQFQDEMGGIAEAVLAYNAKWTTPAISDDPAGFSRETADLFRALKARIEAENGTLYPLADRAA